MVTLAQKLGQYAVGIFLLSLLFGQLPSLVLPFHLPLFVHDIALFMLLLITCLYRVYKKRFVWLEIFTPIGLFVAVTCISLIPHIGVLQPDHWMLSSLYIVRWITYASLVWIVVQMPISTKFWQWGLYIVIVSHALLGFAQLILYPDMRNLLYLGWDPHYFRLVGTLFDPNFMGIVLVCGIFLGFRLNARRTWWYACQGLLYVCLYLTYSRSALVALIAGTCVMAALTLKRKYMYPLCSVLFVFLIAFFVIPKPGGDTLRFDRYDSTYARIMNWTEGIALGLRQPLLGLGFNTLPYRPGIIGIDDTKTATPSRAGSAIDSSVVFVFVTTGIIGLVSYIFLFFSLWKILWKRYTQDQNARGLLGLFVALIVHSMFNNSLFYPWTLILLWIVVGICEAENRITSRT